MSKVSIATAASGDVVTVEELRRYARIGERAQDTVLDDLLAQAVESAESYTWRRLLTQTWDQYWDSFSGEELRLRYPPMSSVTYVKYLDTNGDTQTLSTDVYETGDDEGVTVIRLKYNQTWPSTRAHSDAVWARFVCGYGTGADVPDRIKLAIRLFALHRYRHREDDAIPEVFYQLLMPYVSPDKYVYTLQGA